MGELSQAMRIIGSKLPLCLIQNPKGTWHFVGSVPVVLSHDGPAEDIATGLKFGFGLVRKTVKTLTWETAAEAIAAAEAMGFTVAQTLPTRPFDCRLCGQHITDGKPCGCGARP